MLTRAERGWVSSYVNSGGCARRQSSTVCYRVRRQSDRPSVTELPRLTSDSILTADRRGGILISFGPEPSRRVRINPSDLVGSRTPSWREAPDCFGPKPTPRVIINPPELVRSSAGHRCAMPTVSA